MDRQKFINGRRTKQKMEKRKIDMFHPFVSESAIKAVSDLLKTKMIGPGPNIEEFEKKFSEKFKTYNSVAVNTGTAALHLAYILSKVGLGDEVITTPQTCPATSHPILYQSAKPVFADIQYETGNLDPNDVRKKITEKTKAIVCVDWGGYPCDLDELKEIAEEHNIPLIEDAAQSLGAKYKGNYIGSIADYTCFSFQAIKIMTMVDGGMLCVKDNDKYKEALRREWYGVDKKAVKPSIFGGFNYDTFEIGYKYKMNNVTATMGLEQLKHFDSLFERRKEIAKKYREELENIPKLTLFENKKNIENTNYLFSIHVQDRNKFAEMMKSKGIEVSVMHTRNDKLKVFGGKAMDLPNMARFSETSICIPIHNHLSDDDVDYVVKSIKEGW